MRRGSPGGTRLHGAPPWIGLIAIVVTSGLFLSASHAWAQPDQAQASPTWRAGPPLDQCAPTSPACGGRYGHSASLLPDGRVLVVGGSTGAEYLTSVEIFDPRASTWRTAAPLHRARTSHNAIPLPGGALLIVGGTELQNESGQSETAELYRAGSAGGPGTWTEIRVTGGGHGDGSAATLLDDGQVLVTGGVGQSLGTTGVDLFNPETGRWVATAPLSKVRVYHAAVLLKDGRVLVAGGEGTNNGPKISSAEVYDPRTASWSPTGSLPYTPIRASAVTLPDGRVLLAGGASGKDNNGPSTNSVLYDPVSGVWQPTGPLNVARDRQTAALLPDGRVLIAGGDYRRAPTAEVYEPSTRTWHLTAPMVAHRNEASVTVLGSSRAGCRTACFSVLVAGGETGNLASTEVLGEASLETGSSGPAAAGTAAAGNPGGSSGSRPGWALPVGLVAAATLVAAGAALISSRRRRRSRPAAPPIR